MTFQIAGLPSTGVVALSDDDVELARTTPSTVRGEWNFRTNTDGGVIGGLPFPGTWHLTITPELFRSITVWTFFTGGSGDLAVAAEIPLDLTQPVEIIASDATATCRPTAPSPAAAMGGSIPEKSATTATDKRATAAPLAGPSSDSFDYFDPRGMRRRLLG